MPRLLEAILLGAALVSLVPGCNPKTQPPTAEPTAPADTSPAPEDAKDTTGPSVSLPQTKFPGVAHSGNIDMVAICPKGTCALSRDAVGGVRLWSALDGTAEPQPVPIRGPKSIAVAKTKKGFTVFAVEASGGARVFSMEADGHAKELAALAPFDPVAQALVLPGGQRLLALMKDGSARLLDREGKELSKLDEKRFHPYQLRLSADGKHFVAIVRLERSAGKFRSEVQRFEIGGTDAAPKLQRSGSARIVHSTNELDDTTLVVSPDGSLVATAARAEGDKWELEVFDLAKDGDPKTLKVQIPTHVVPRLGFVSPRGLLASSNDGSMSWVIDIEDGSARPRTAAPQDFNHQGRVQAVAPNRQISGYGAYLFVHDVKTRSHRFLGYRATQGAGVGLSADGKYVAWAYVQGPLVVEPAMDSDEPARTVEMSMNNNGATRVRFFDEDHLIVVDGGGEATLMNWRTSEIMDRAGVMGNVRNVRLDPEQGMLLIDRHNNDAWLFTVDLENGFDGPYIIADKSHRMGLLRPSPPSDLVVWTLDGANALREYSLDQLRSDLTQGEMEKMGKELKRGQPAPLAIDHLGRHYGVRWNGSELELFVDQGEKLGTKAVPSSDVNQILPSPAGDRFLVVFNRSGSVSVAMYETDTLKPLWSYATGVFNNDTSWSADGRFVGLAATTGAVLLDAATGEPLRKRCGLNFVALASIPQNAFNSPNQRSLCEL